MPRLTLFPLRSGLAVLESSTPAMSHRHGGLAMADKDCHTQEDFESSKRHRLHTQLPQANERKVHGAMGQIASAWPGIRRLVGAMIGRCMLPFGLTRSLHWLLENAKDRSPPWEGQPETQRGFQCEYPFQQSIHRFRRNSVGARQELFDFGTRRGPWL
jgi:hypothetical protein